MVNPDFGSAAARACCGTYVGWSLSIANVTVGRFSEFHCPADPQTDLTRRHFARVEVWLDELEPVLSVPRCTCSPCPLHPYPGADPMDRLYLQFVTPEHAFTVDRFVYRGPELVSHVRFVGCRFDTRLLDMHQNYRDNTLSLIGELHVSDIQQLVP